MRTELKWFGGSKAIETDESESSLYKAIGQALSEIPIPNRLTVSVIGGGNAVFDLKSRGSYIKDGMKMPSLYVIEISNSIDLPSDTYEDAYLTCINYESNNYKFYWLKPRADGVYATYGRIGSEKGEMFGEKDLKDPYPSRLYWIRYYEKLGKGYVDQTDIFFGKKPKKKTHKQKQEEIPEIDVTLYQMLKKWARQVVEKSLVSSHVTCKQISACRSIYRQMQMRKTLKGFNSQLLKLMQLSPRKIGMEDCVDNYLAHDTEDFPSILNREEELLMAMDALATGDDANAGGSFKSFGIEILEATDEDLQLVKQHLEGTPLSNLRKVYVVKDVSKEKREDDYCKKRSIKDRRLLWHGSANCNWLSIIVNGLQLNPDAQICAKGFGNGIYTAISCLKSWNYTRGGADGTKFLGLYDVAYGKPYLTQTCHMYTQDFLNKEGCDSVHANKGNQSFRDEIMVYDESALCIKYLCEFAA